MPTTSHVMAKPIDPGSTSIRGTVRSEGGQSTMNVADKPILKGGVEDAVTSEYAQMNAAMANPITARKRVKRRRLRLARAKSIMEVPRPRFDAPNISPHY